MNRSARPFFAWGPLKDPTSISIEPLELAAGLGGLRGRVTPGSRSRDGGRPSGADLQLRDEAPDGLSFGRWRAQPVYKLTSRGRSRATGPKS